MHYILQIAFGWSDTYLHQFKVHGKAYGIGRSGCNAFDDNPCTTCLKKFHFHQNERFLYEYNFFAFWQIEIRLEKIVLAELKKFYPICIGGKYSAPEEECRGAVNYMQLLNHYSPAQLEIMLLDGLNQYQSEHDKETLCEILEKLKYWVNQTRFNHRYVNMRLQQYANDDPQWEEHFFM